MSLLSIHGLTLSVDIGDKSFGNGQGRFISLSAKVPEGEEGIPLSDSESLISDGLELYFTAWQTLMQARCATGEITGKEYKVQTANFITRIEKIKAIYQTIKGKSIAELEEFLKKAEEANVQGS